MQGLALGWQKSSSRSLRPHGLEPRIFREGLLELRELLDRLALVPGEALLENLDAEHRVRLILLELTLVLLDVLATALHLRPALPQLVLLFLQPLLDDLRGDRVERLAGVVHEVRREDVDLSGGLLGL